MGLLLETGLRDALADEIDNYINTLGTAPHLMFETVANAEVADIVMSTTNAFGASSNGTITMTGQPLSDTNAAGGTIDHFCIYANAGQTNKVLTGSVGTSGESINITNLTITATETVELTSFTITVPAGAV